MARANNSFYAILGILSIGPMSGYKIKAWVNEGVGYFWDIDYKQIYPALKNLVEEGMATFEVVKTENRPDSKVYKLTDKGRNEFKDWLIKPIPDGNQSTKELMLKLFFGQNIPLEININHIEKYREAKITSLREMEGIKEAIDNDSVKDAFLYYRVATINKGISQLQTEIEWCNKTIDYLKDNVK